MLGGGNCPGMACTRSERQPVALIRSAVPEGPQDEPLNRQAISFAIQPTASQPVANPQSICFDYWASGNGSRPESIEPPGDSFWHHPSSQLPSHLNYRAPEQVQARIVVRRSRRQANRQATACRQAICFDHGAPGIAR